jgi:hypothetical protein
MDDFQILLDEPVERPTLGFDQYARAFAELIRRSEPRFAVGIFGDWGSGKTTLMHAIQRRLEVDETVVALWFNAWRYEREEHLIVPLLDTLREALVGWAERPGRDRDLRDRAVQAAATVARAARAILAGLSVTARLGGLPAGAELAFDAGRTVADWRQTAEEAAQQSRSPYHASFRALRASLAEFVERGQQRIVVFVDDLDRCLPASALEVLESMKLFFDLEGFVFVVGLDREVVERAIEAKYRPLQAGADGGVVEAPVKGSEYIKKMFQVPFVLPPVSPLQLDDFLRSLDQAGLPDEQRDDLQLRVRPHLSFVITEAGVNPREIKRYVNAYTLQRKTRPALDAEVVLCLQTLAYRTDWENAYEVLLAEREVFTDAVRRQLDGNPAAVENLWPELAGVPDSFFDYLGSLGRQLLAVTSLDPYLHSMEATRSTQPGVVATYQVLGDLRGQLRSFAGTATIEGRRRLRGDFSKQLPLLRNAAVRMSRSPPAARLQADVEELSRRSEPDAGGVVPPVSTEDEQAELEAWHRAADELLTRMQARLRELRRTATLGPTP